MNNEIISEYETVKNNVGFFDFSMEGKIKVTGTKRVEFINGMVTNDIENLENFNGVYAAFLDRFGKVLTDCIIYKFQDYILINMNIIGKKNIFEKLVNDAKLAYLKIEDITLKYALFSLQGPRSQELINDIFKSKIELENKYQSIIINSKNNYEENNSTNKNTIIEKNKNNGIKLTDNKKDINNNELKIIITKNNRTNFNGYDIFVPASMYKEFKDLILERGQKYNLKIINNETYDILRLEAKVPLYGIDFDQNNTLPEITEKAVNYEKGCYVGQEIVARVKNLGKGITAKKLVFLEIEGIDVPEINSKIIKDDKEVGTITSSAFSPKLEKAVSLGILNKGYYESGTIVTVNNTKATIKTL